MPPPTPPLSDAEKASNETLKTVAQWFEGKSLEELRAVEHNGRLFWPDTLKRRGLKGDIVETPCYLRSPHTTEKAQSIIFANQIVQKMIAGKDVLTREGAISYVGLDAYSELETASLLSICIHETVHPYAQMYRHDNIAKEVGMAAMYEVYDRLDFYSKLEDVRVGALTENAFWTLVRKVARVMNLSPLLGISGSARDTFIVSMASHLDFLTRRPSSPSSEISTPEPSTQP